MQETIKEVLERYKNEYTDVEIYRFKAPSKYYGGRIHTDTLEYLNECFNVDYNKTFDLDEQLMDEDEYNNTVLANTGVYFTDMYNANDKVLVIILLDAHIINDTVYNQEEWEKMD